MKVAVLGAGAVGSLFGGWLSRANQVWLIAKNREHIRAVARDGLLVSFSGGEERFFPGVTDDPTAVGPVDLVLIAVKAYDTLTACESAAPLVGPETTVLSLQNGIGNLETLQGAFGVARVLVGSTGHGARMIQPGVIRHSGSGDTTIAEPEAARGKARPVVEAFREAGARAAVSESVASVLWGKLLVNCAVNPVTALLGIANGRILEIPPAWELAASALDEAFGVARALGVELPYPDPAAQLREVCGATAENRSSMLVDLETRGRTEIDFINGAVTRAAAGLRVAAPVNQSLWLMVKAKEMAAG